MRAFLRVFTDQESKFETPGRNDISPTMNLITGVTKGNRKKEKDRKKERKKLGTQQLQSGALLPSVDLKTLSHLISYLSAHEFYSLNRANKLQTAV